MITEDNDKPLKYSNFKGRRSNPFKRESKRNLAKRFAKWKRTNPVEYEAHLLLTNSRRRLREGASDTLTIDEWNRRLREYGGKCAYCTEPADPLELEHMMPLSRGGGNDISNIVPACRKCNASKGDLTIDEWRESGNAPEALKFFSGLLRDSGEPDSLAPAPTEEKEIQK